MSKVGVKFCGGCNPDIDRAKVYREIRELAGDISFTNFQEEGLDAFLLVCGCPTACPVEELGLHGHPKAIVIAGETLDGIPISASALARAVAARLKRDWQVT